MTLFRRLCASLMMALLVLAGQQVSMARASGPAVMTAVLCIGGGLVTVMLDAEGNPTGPPHTCPDATLAFLPDLALPRPQARPVTVSALAPRPPAAAPHPALGPRLPAARGPPLSV